LLNRIWREWARLERIRRHRIHPLAGRRPLPPVPKVKTQEEKDLEAFDVFNNSGNGFSFSINGNALQRSMLLTVWLEAIAYARKGAK